jgi:hypothetical protein
VATDPKDEQINFQAACGYALAAGAGRVEQVTAQAVGAPLPSAVAAAIDALLVWHDTNQALGCLRKGKARGWTDVVKLETDPDFEPIRHDPAFLALIAEFPRPGGTRP